MVVGKGVKSNQDRLAKVQGGVSSWQSKAEVRGSVLPSKATFQTIPWIRINIKKGHDRGKLQISWEKLLPSH